MAGFLINITRTKQLTSAGSSRGNCLGGAARWCLSLGSTTARGSLCLGGTSCWVSVILSFDEYPTVGNIGPARGAPHNVHIQGIPVVNVAIVRFISDDVFRFVCI